MAAYRNPLSDAEKKGGVVESTANSPCLADPACAVRRRL